MLKKKELLATGTVVRAVHCLSSFLLCGTGSKKIRILKDKGKFVVNVWNG